MIPSSLRNSFLDRLPYEDAVLPHGIAPLSCPKVCPPLHKELWEQIYSSVDKDTLKQAVLVDRATYHICQELLKSKCKALLPEKWEELKKYAHEILYDFKNLMEELEREEIEKLEDESEIDFYLLFQELALKTSKGATKLSNHRLITTFDDYQHLDKQAHTKDLKKAARIIVLLPVILYFTYEIGVAIYCESLPFSSLTKRTLYCVVYTVVVLWAVKNASYLRPGHLLD